jgi:hypothetical protein
MLYDLFYDERIISEAVFITILDSAEIASMLRNSHNHSQRCRLNDHLNQFQNSLQKLVLFINFIIFDHKVF